MLSALLAGALITGAALACGQAITRAAGHERFSPVAPVAGLSALLVVCGIAVKLPGHGTTAAIAAAIAVAAALAYLWPVRGDLGRVRVGAVAAALIAAAVVAIPFAASGRVGILGQGLVNDDMASHLLFAEWVDTREGPTPDLVEDGYPLGPHAVIAAVDVVAAPAAGDEAGDGLIEGFAGLTGAIAILTVLTAYGALGGVRDRFRAPAAALVAVPYLSAAYLAQGAFKEPMLAVGLLGFALWLPSLARVWDGLQPTYVSIIADRPRNLVKAQARLALPGAAIAAGAIYNYSFPGLAWLAGAAIVWALLVAWRERDRREDSLQLRARLRWSRPFLITLIGIVVLAALSDVLNLVRFLSFEAFSPSGEGGNTGFGNLRQPLNPLEAFGIWPSAEFRIAPANASTPAIAFWLGGLLAVSAFAWGLARALARRENALLATLAVGAVGYVAAAIAGTPYTSAKSLAIAAPVVILITLRGLLSARALEGEPSDAATWWPPAMPAAVPDGLRPALRRWGLPALGAAFVAAAALSSLLPLRQAAVGPTATSEELISFRGLVDGEDVLFLGRDNFISWELLGAEVYTPILNHYDTEETSTLYRATPINAKFDWDNVPAEGLDGPGLGDFDWVLTTSADFNSEPPPEFAIAEASEDFVLWRRKPGAKTPVGDEPGVRRTLLEPLYPGAALDCSAPGTAPLTRIDGVARVLNRAPVVGTADLWEPQPEFTEAGAAAQELRLPPGRWAISIQYASTQELRISAPAVGFERTLEPNLLFRGPSPYYPAGEVEVPRSVAVRFEARVADPPLAGRLLGTESRAYLGTIAATPIAVDRDPAAGLVGAEGAGLVAVGPARTRGEVPLPGACGRYADWYTLAPGTSEAELAAVEAPERRPPQGTD